MYTTRSVVVNTCISVVRLCTKFDGNRTIRAEVIDDLSKISPALRHALTLSFDSLILHRVSRVQTLYKI